MFCWKGFQVQPRPRFVVRSQQPWGFISNECSLLRTCFHRRDRDTSARSKLKRLCTSKRSRLLPTASGGRIESSSGADAVIPPGGHAGTASDDRRKTLLLPEPFMVLATQNPIEQEGVYRLPEAQWIVFSFEFMSGTQDASKRSRCSISIVGRGEVVGYQFSRRDCGHPKNVG